MKCPKFIRRLYLKIRSHFPTKLPLRGSEVNPWYQLFLETYPIFPDENPTLHALATMISHEDRECTRRSMAWYYKLLRASMSKEIAFDVIQDMKKQQKDKEIKAKEEADKKLLDTPIPQPQVYS